MPDWTGPTCFMCDGTGEDFTYSGKAMQPTRRDVPTGRPCRACNGHGVDADDRVNPPVKRDIPCVGDYSGGTNKRPPRAANSGGPAGTYLGGPTA